MKIDDDTCKDLIKLSKDSINKTVSYRTYKAEGKEIIEVWKLLIELSENIIELNNKLEEKPKTVERIIYRKQ